MTARLRPALGRRWLATNREHRLLARAAQLRPDEARRLAERRLGALLVHASHANQVWRQRLADAGVVVDGLVDLDRLPDLPPLERDEVAADPWRLVADDLGERRWYRNRSGGSTGVPVEVVQDREYLRWARAVKALFDTFTGYVPGQPKVVLWGARRDAAFHPPASTRLRHWAKNEVWLDAHRMRPAAMATWAKALDRHRPVQLLGYAESLEVWARFLRDEGLVVRAPGAVLSTAGVLTPAMRRTLEDVFRAPVFDRYGSREVGDLACETADQDGLVVPPLHAHIEVVDDTGHPLPPGEEGEVLVTSLTNRAMPLVRYRIGDRAAWAPPPSDRAGTRTRPAWPRLARITGRVTDHFVAVDGTHVHPGALRALLHDVGGLRAYQLVQETPTAVTVRVVAAHDAPPDLPQRLRAHLRPPLSRLLGRGVEVMVDLVEELPTTPTGKHRHAVSLVGRPDRDR